MLVKDDLIFLRVIGSYIKKIVVFFLDDELQCDEQCQTKEQYLAYINATRI